MGRKNKKKFQYLKMGYQNPINKTSETTTENKKADKNWSNNLKLNNNKIISKDKEKSQNLKVDKSFLGIKKEQKTKDLNIETVNSKDISSKSDKVNDINDINKKGYNVKPIKSKEFVGYNSYNQKNIYKSSKKDSEVILLDNNLEHEKKHGFVNNHEQKESEKNINQEKSFKDDFNHQEVSDHHAYKELKTNKPKTFLEYTKMRSYFGLNKKKVQKEEKQIEYLHKKGLELLDKNRTNDSLLNSIDKESSKDNEKNDFIDNEKNYHKEKSETEILRNKKPIDNRYSNGIDPKALGIITKRVPRARITRSNTEILTKSSFKKINEKSNNNLSPVSSQKKQLLKRNDRKKVETKLPHSAQANSKTNNVALKPELVNKQEKITVNKQEKNMNEKLDNHILNEYKKMELPNGLIIGSGYTLTDKYKKHRDLTEIENRHKNSLYALLYKGEKKKMEKNDVFLTKEGLKKLEEELKRLKTEERNNIADRLKTAKSYGDLSENGEYDEAKSAQEANESRIAEIEEMISNAKIIEEGNINTEFVGVGNTVYITNISTNKEQKYTIVGTAESDILDGKISNESPIAKSLLGAQVGDIVQVEAPVGIIEYKIKKITL